MRISFLIFIFICITGPSAQSQCSIGGAAWLNGQNDGFSRDTGIIAGSVLVYANTVGTMTSGRPLYRVSSSTWKGLNYAALEVWRAYSLPAFNYTSFKLQTPLDSTHFHLRVDNIRGDLFNWETQQIRGFLNGVPVAIDFKDPVNGAFITGGNTINGGAATTTAVQSAMRAFFRGPVDSIVVQQTSLGDWIIAQLMIECNYIVPLELTDLFAENKQNGIVVTWTTASESPTLKKFVLENSRDGRNFEQVAAFPAKGSGSTYSLIDTHPHAPDNFYRLRYDYIDGKTEYSKVLRVAWQHGADRKIRIYPNPASDLFTLSMSMVPENGTIYNAEGRLMGKIMPKSGSQQIRCAQWPAGLYWLKLILPNGEVVTAKILRQ